MSVLLGLQVVAAQSLTDTAAQPTARIALIIDDLGNRLDDGLRAVRLPGRVNVSILPHTPHAHQLAWQARYRDVEVLLHLPMAANHHNLLGPGGLEADFDREQMTYAVKAALESVPHVQGVNNHMGSLLTRQRQPMQWLMQTLHEMRVGYFLDSRTTPDSIAENMARQAGLHSLRRSVFLDHYPDAESVELEFDRLVRIARRTGSAVGIGHPRPVTLQMLERRIPELQRQGIELVHVSSLIPAGAPAPAPVPVGHGIALEGGTPALPGLTIGPMAAEDTLN